VNVDDRGAGPRAAMPSATMSRTAIGMPGCRARDQGPFSATSSQTLRSVTKIAELQGNVRYGFAQ
jgi:hypothetical protein